MKKYTLRHVAITLGVIFGIIAVLYSTIILRDYNISFDGGIRLVAKYPVPGAPAMSLRSDVKGQIVIGVTGNGASAYDVQVSLFKNMMFAKTYRTTLNQKTVSMLFGNTTYYVRARSVGKVPGTTRSISGRWGNARAITTKGG